MEQENTGPTLYPDLATPATEQNVSSPEIVPLEEDPIEQMKRDLAKTEDEIATLRQVLTAKEHFAADLRKKLGLTPLSHLSQSFKAELNKVQSSNAYQSTTQKVSELNEKITTSEYYKKTSETLKTAGQTTASAISSLGSSMSQKLSEMNLSVGQSAANINLALLKRSPSNGIKKNSQAFKSFEEKVEGVGTTLMAKVSGTSAEPNAKPMESTDSSQETTPVTEQPQHNEQVTPPL